MFVTPKPPKFPVRTSSDINSLNLLGRNTGDPEPGTNLNIRDLAGLSVRTRNNKTCQWGSCDRVIYSGLLFYRPCKISTLCHSAIGRTSVWKDKENRAFMAFMSS
ncbi:hypothetical protein Zmor_012793 [Zophobas morio]|uniref:Uncharacterized protein n=1 Tax=Zophobas morio TaxID=2755281 RepID=A0AA38IBV4_9CUCU|nr:hypothetical protein Zmor_012793 [Zophobas morio]